MRLSLFCLLFLLAIPSPTAASAARAPGAVQSRIDPDLQERLQRFGSRLETLRREQRIPGMSVAIVKNGKVVDLLGLGSAADGAPATPDTAYPVPALIGPSGQAWTVRNLANLDVLLGHGAIVESQPLLAWHTEDTGGHRLRWAWEHQTSGTVLWLKIPEKKLSLILVGRGDFEKTSFATALTQAF